MKATEVTACLAESNGSLLLGLCSDSLYVTCGLTACTPGSSPGPTLGNEYGKTLPLPFNYVLQLITELAKTYGPDTATGRGQLCQLNVPARAF